MARDGVDGASAGRRIEQYFGVASLDGFGQFTKAELIAAATVLAYVERTQLGARPPLAPPVRAAGGRALQIDAATRANLELTRTLAGQRQGSLLHCIDMTATPAGGRLLAERLAGPLTDVAAIRRRQESVALCHEDGLLRERLRTALKAAPDMPRALSRLAMDRGGPRDLACIRDGVAAAGDAREACFRSELGPELAEADDGAGRRSTVRSKPFCAAALDDELPLLKRDGGFVRAGHAPELDEMRALRDDSRRVIAGPADALRRNG